LFLTLCLIEKPDGTVTEDCYSKDFRGSLQEVTLERFFKTNFETTDDILMHSFNRNDDQILQQIWWQTPKF
jgi:hypothetical protein